ncbi:MAG: FAD:protein FMN transferase [uncultured Phycisphaerae bacterium]|uniref:FAD:protein FMN transferase n=1 Tax=uncultured Phycisphaerae bacterium TaxID=904963 RepID=A0A6J4PDF8_9BACT|nr:MAG: FAD:protein FMN transferase [uncultured Phycisphaerae bacterium]
MLQSHDTRLFLPPRGSRRSVRAPVFLLVGMVVAASSAGCREERSGAPAGPATAASQPAPPQTAPAPLAPPRTAPATTASAALQRFEFQQPKMGAAFRIVLYAPDQGAADRAAEAAFVRVDALNAILSDYDPESEISRLSRRTLDGPMAKPVKVSDELFHVLDASQKVAKLTDGAFDVTVGPFGGLWRRSNQLGQLPKPARIEEARRSVGHQHVRLDPGTQTVQLLAPRMKLDVAGIAVGYVVDEALRALGKAGVDRALIDAGGDLGMTGPPPGAKGWRVAVQSLRAPQETTGEFVELSHASISTSGDTYRYVEIDGVRYSHILDPRTGLGLTQRIGVTAIARDGLTADWLDTAVAVLGRERGTTVVESTPGAAARITTIGPDGGITVSETAGFRRFVAPGR